MPYLCLIVFTCQRAFLVLLFRLLDCSCFPLSSAEWRTLPILYYLPRVFLAHSLPQCNRWWKQMVDSSFAVCRGVVWPHGLPFTSLSLDSEPTSRRGLGTLNEVITHCVWGYPLVSMYPHLHLSLCVCTWVSACTETRHQGWVCLP